MNFVYTDEHKKRRLNELDDNEGELPVLLSNNSYSFTDGHKEELIEYYNQAGFTNHLDFVYTQFSQPLVFETSIKNHENVTKFDFIRHFMTKWRMSEHPLERKIKDWLGPEASFSTQFCTDQMRLELVEFYRENNLSQDDVCKLFGAKWQRRPALLKKQLQRGLELKPELSDDEDLPTLTSDSRYTFSEQHKQEFIDFYHEKRDEMTKTAFLRHFSEKWHMSEHPLQRKMKAWLGENPAFSTEFCTDNMKKELVDFYNQNCDSMSHDDVAKHFSEKWQRKSTLLKKQLQRSLVQGRGHQVNTHFKT